MRPLAISDLPAKALGLALAALILLAGLLMNMPAQAAGGSSAPSTTQAVNPDYAAGEAAVKSGDYQQAITLMTKVVASEPRNADALNYLGYSHRKLGDFETSMTFYGKALDADPDHRGANEYLGELYLQMGDVEKAEAQLARLDRICFFGCEEYRELKQAIAAYRSGEEPDAPKW